MFVGGGRGGGGGGREYARKGYSMGCAPNPKDLQFWES